MEAVRRKPYQGVFNIIRFNWHFYVFAVGFVMTLFTAALLLDKLLFWICISIAIAIMASTCISLVVSYYIYDRSGLYNFHWLRQVKEREIRNIINIHAGFDETSIILRKAFPESTLRVFDFYDPFKHTEVSIERARKAYPPFPATIKITTSKLPIAADYADIIFNFFALHEVRDRKERIDFLKHQSDTLRNDGRVVIVEHLRNIPNFLAYNIGFLHFFSRREWFDNFLKAGFAIERQFKITHFITIFILKKLDGNTP